MADRVVTVRALTYNVHGHKGMDGRVAPGRILKILRTAQADIIGLQEFVNRRPHGEHELIDRWATALGYHGAYATSFHRGGEDFGNALLSRFPIVELHERDLGVAGHRSRVMLDAIVDAGPYAIQVMVVHLGVSPVERRKQTRGIIDALFETRAALHILMGDFNEWHELSAFSRRLRRYFRADRRVATFPAVRPILGLDRIWVQPKNTAITTRSIRTARTRVASDHLPLLATIAAPSE